MELEVIIMVRLYVKITNCMKRVREHQTKLRGNKKAEDKTMF